MIVDWGTVVRIRDLIAIAIDVINVIAYMYIHRHLNAIALAHKLHTYIRTCRAHRTRLYVHAYTHHNNASFHSSVHTRRLGRGSYPAFMHPGRGTVVGYLPIILLPPWARPWRPVLPSSVHPPPRPLVLMATGAGTGLA